MWGLEIKHLKAHNFVRQWCFFIFNFDDRLGSNFYKFVILCICSDSPSEKTGLWQLPIVSRVFNGVIKLKFAYQIQKWEIPNDIFVHNHNTLKWNDSQNSLSKAVVNEVLPNVYLPFKISFYFLTKHSLFILFCFSSSKRRIPWPWSICSEMNLRKASQTKVILYEILFRKKIMHVCSEQGSTVC